MTNEQEVCKSFLQQTHDGTAINKLYGCSKTNYGKEINSIYKQITPGGLCLDWEINGFWKSNLTTIAGIGDSLSLFGINILDRLIKDKEDKTMYVSLFNNAEDVVLRYLHLNSRINFRNLIQGLVNEYEQNIIEKYKKAFNEASPIIVRSSTKLENLKNIIKEKVSKHSIDIVIIDGSHLLYKGDSHVNQYEKLKHNISELNYLASELGVAIVCLHKQECIHKNSEYLSCSTTVDKKEERILKDLSSEFLTIEDTLVPTNSEESNSISKQYNYYTGKFSKAIKFHYHKCKYYISESPITLKTFIMEENSPIKLVERNK